MLVQLAVKTPSGLRLVEVDFGVDADARAVARGVPVSQTTSGTGGPWNSVSGWRDASYSPSTRFALMLLFLR